ncbi:hypothetical protein AB0I94_32300 [Streptomyces sp. NPDC050147]|uniref:hypothetical protein n=1 Tax=Streptomyces sp. NPDC050147 TaxID=3155513 RepID=UPI00342E0C48
MTAWPRVQQPRKPAGHESPDIGGARLRRVNRWLVEDLLEDLADLYVEGFDGELPRSIEQVTESDQAFAITNILVRPHRQDQALARRLQERLLGDHQASLGAALVGQADHPDLTAFRAWGWQDIGESWRPAGATVFRVLALPLGERIMVRLEGLAHHAWTRWPG